MGLEQFVVVVSFIKESLLARDNFFHFDEFVDFSDELFTVSRANSGISDVHHLVIDEKVDFGVEEVICGFRLRGGILELVLGRHQQ